MTTILISRSSEDGTQGPNVTEAYPLLVRVTAEVENTSTKYRERAITDTADRTRRVPAAGQFRSILADTAPIQAGVRVGNQKREIGWQPCEMIFAGNMPKDVTLRAKIALRLDAFITRGEGKIPFPTMENSDQKNTKTGSCILDKRHMKKCEKGNYFWQRGCRDRGAGWLLRKGHSAAKEPLSPRWPIAYTYNRISAVPALW